MSSLASRWRDGTIYLTRRISWVDGGICRREAAKRQFSLSVESSYRRVFLAPAGKTLVGISDAEQTRFIERFPQKLKAHR